MTLHKKIEKELTNRFKKANFKPITITMKKSGDKVIITPCSELGHIKNMNDISYFLIESQYVNLCGCDTLSELAQTIQNYEDIREQTLKEKHKCHEYYEHNIKGNPVEKLTQGNQYANTIWKAWIAQDEIKDYREFEKQYPIQNLCVKTKQTEEYIKDAISLSHNYEYFSDWYKELYGRRPHNSNNEDIL